MSYSVIDGLVTLVLYRTTMLDNTDDAMLQYVTFVKKITDTCKCTRSRWYFRLIAYMMKTASTAVNLNVRVST